MNVTKSGWSIRQLELHLSGRSTEPRYVISSKLSVTQPGYCRPVHGGDTHRMDDVTGRAEEVDPRHQQRKCSVAEVYSPDEGHAGQGVECSFLEGDLVAAETL